MVHVYEVGVKSRAPESARLARGGSACGGVGGERDPAAAPSAPRGRTNP